MLTFEEQLASLYECLKGRDLLSPLRQRAWEHFQELGLPQKKLEAFQYLPLSSFYAQEFAPASTISLPCEEFLPYIYPECRENFLVMINGIFFPELSRTSAIALPLEEAMKTYGSFLQSRFFKEERDPFVRLNEALHKKGLFIYIPPKTRCTAPLQCLHLVCGNNVGVFPRIQIFVGKDAEMQWIYRSLSLGTSSWVSGVTDIALEENATLHSYPIIAPSSWHFESVRATLKKCSRFKSVGFTHGSPLFRQDFRIQLQGEGGDAELQGLWKLKGHDQCHTHVHVEHAAPYCRSLQRFKGVLDEGSRSSFEGKIYVQQCAQKTEAYQVNNNLLLGERAQAYSKPNLEIFADDVKASHGATISQLDPLHLFYLKTRGLAEEDAKQFLVKGFCQTVYDEVPYGLFA